MVGTQKNDKQSTVGKTLRLWFQDVDRLRSDCKMALPLKSRNSRPEGHTCHKASFGAPHVNIGFHHLKTFSPLFQNQIQSNQILCHMREIQQVLDLTVKCLLTNP